jgi:hypothetical protein
MTDYGEKIQNFQIQEAAQNCKAHLFSALEKIIGAYVIVMCEQKYYTIIMIKVTKDGAFLCVVKQPGNHWGGLKGRKILGTGKTTSTEKYFCEFRRPVEMC